MAVDVAVLVAVVVAMAVADRGHSGHGHVYDQGHDDDQQRTRSRLGMNRAAGANALQIFLVRTEEKIVSAKTRLETVFRLRETEEDRARLALADAQRDVAQATDQLSAAQARAATDHRKLDSAAHWTLIESAHARALQEARQAEHAVQKASDGLSQSRARYLGAHTRTEALRKAIEARRAEMVRQETQAERKYMDEIAMLLRQGVA